MTGHGGKRQEAERPKGVGIFSWGIDKRIESIHGKIVIAAIEGELTVKRLSRKEGRVQLTENRKYKPTTNPGFSCCCAVIHSEARHVCLN